MVYEKRVYLTKVVKVDKTGPFGEIFDSGQTNELGQNILFAEIVTIPTNVPYLASLPLDPSSPEDPYHWDVIYDDKGDEDGLTPGTHEFCFVGVYTTLENHQILEADPDITRIDDI